MQEEEDAMIKVNSFGIIPLKKEDSQWKVFIVKHKAGHWGFPKGHSNGSERPQETAERELMEETGFFVEKYLPFESFCYSYHCVSHGKEVNKTVSLFAALVKGQINLCSVEIEEGKWIVLEKVCEKIQFVQIHQIIEQLQSLLLKNC